jgi:hypothetical protein
MVVRASNLIYDTEYPEVFHSVPECLQPNVRALNYISVWLFSFKVFPFNYSLSTGYTHRHTHTDTHTQTHTHRHTQTHTHTNKHIHTHIYIQ